MYLEQPRLGPVDVDRVLVLTTEICALNDAIRQAGEPSARQALAGRRDALLAELRRRGM